MTDTKVFLQADAYRWLLSIFEADTMLADSLHVFEPARGVRLMDASGTYFLAMLWEVLGDESLVEAVCDRMASGAEFPEALHESGIAVLGVRLA